MEKETVQINQHVSKKAYHKLKAYCILNGKDLQDEVNQAIIEYADKIKS